MRRESWWALVVLGVGGAYAGMRVLGTYWDFNAAASELPQAVRDYRAAGLPWTAADIERHVAIKDNAAPLVRRALAMMPGKSVDRAFDTEYVRGTAVPTAYAPALAIFHKAAKLPDLDFGRDWDLGGSLRYEELGPVKRACKALVVRAARYAAHGDDAGALRDLEDAYRLATLLGKEPSSMGATSSAACERFTSQGVRKCLAQTIGQPERIARYRRLLDRSAAQIDADAAFRGSLYAVVAEARNLDRMGLGRGFWPDVDNEPFISDCSGCVKLDRSVERRRDGLPENVRTRAYLARFLQAWTGVARETHGFHDAPDSILRRTDALSDLPRTERGLSYRFNPLLFPAYIDFERLNGVIEANRAITRVLADALVLHARNGRWPVATGERDPLGNGPLHVRFDGKRFRVWSIGRDGHDDGGLTKSEALKAGDRSDDEIAAYPPVPIPPSKFIPTAPSLYAEG